MSATITALGQVRVFCIGCPNAHGVAANDFNSRDDNPSSASGRPDKLAAAIGGTNGLFAGVDPKDYTMSLFLSCRWGRCRQVAVLPLGSLSVRCSSRKSENECKQRAAQPGQLHDCGAPMLATPCLGRRVWSWRNIARRVRRNFEPGARPGHVQACFPLPSFRARKQKTMVNTWAKMARNAPT